MKIGCCSSFKKCSDAGRCVEIDNPDYEEEFKECYYNENLEKGLNFYTEYNENNRAIAEEYKRKIEDKATLLINQDNDPKNDMLQIEDSSEGTTDIIIEETSNKQDKYKNAYLVINDRQFYIGTRGGYKNYTFGLGTIGIDKLKDSLVDIPIEFDTEALDDKFYDEDGTTIDRAEWRVCVNIGDIEYHIMNSNLYALKESTSRMVAEYFTDLGLKTVCECIGNSRMTFTYTQTVQPKIIDKKIEKVVSNEVEVKEDSQLSLFDF